MKSSGRKHKEKALIDGKPERIFHDGHQIDAASSPATLVVNLPLALLSSEAALKGVSPPTRRAAGEEAFNGLTDEPLSKDRPALRIGATQVRSVARLEVPVCGKIANIPDEVGQTVVRLFGEVGQETTESSTTKK